MEKPFWEYTYREAGSPSTFGGGRPSQEVVDILDKLRSGLKVLDLGCGDGRNAFLPAEKGLLVTALDVSQAAIEKLEHQAKEKGLSIRAIVGDMRYFEFEDSYDLIISYRSLHLIEKEYWVKILRNMKTNTNPKGYNIVSVFTDRLPPPPDLQKFNVGLFKESELFECYRDWRIMLQISRLFEDEHPGGIKHKHASNELVAQKP